MRLLYALLPMDTDQNFYLFNFETDIMSTGLTPYWTAFSQPFKLGFYKTIVVWLTYKQYILYFIVRAQQVQTNKMTKMWLYE